MWINGDSAHAWRAASMRFMVPAALVSKSSNGMAAARSCERLGGGMDNGVRVNLADEREDPGAIANIQFVVLKPRELSLPAAADSSAYPPGDRKNSALVVIDAVDLPAFAAEMDTDFRANEAEGPVTRRVFMKSRASLWGWGEDGGRADRPSFSFSERRVHNFVRRCPPVNIGHELRADENAAK